MNRKQYGKRFPLRPMAPRVLSPVRIYAPNTLDREAVARAIVEAIRKGKA